MLNENQINEIREHLEKAQNPLFLFDNDADGLCSFLLLRRFLGRGKGFPIKTFPDLNVDYIRKVQELEADYVFILDKAVVSEEFFSEMSKFNIPIVWIDHHELTQEVPESVFYYNPLLGNDSTNEPVTDICYKITNKKDDLWIAVVGCVSDCFLPDYYSEFNEKYPELSVRADCAFDVLYKSEIGKIAQMFNFGLKDRVVNVIKMIKFLVSVKTPNEVLERTSGNSEFHDKFEEIFEKKSKLIREAKSLVGDENYFIFSYGGDTSMSSEIANELSYSFPEKLVVVAYPNGGRINLSFRGESIRERVLKILDKLSDATGGGHLNAVGARINFSDFEKFKELVSEEFG